MLLDIVALVAGLVALVFAGDKLVEGSVALAERLRISALVIGLTIVAFGTSAPELFVSLSAAFDNQPGLAIGNVVGSNTANVLLVLGAPALIAAVKCHEDGVEVSNWAMVGLTAIFMVMLALGGIGRLEGAFLFALLLAFIGYQLHAARKGRLPAPDYADEVDSEGLTKRGIAIALVIGVLGLAIGSELTVGGASGLAAALGVSDAVIGLTVVAIGTSLPELVTSVTAALKRSNEVAIGNVIGSNIFNIASIMGITAMVVPLPVSDPRIVQVDMWVMAATTALLVVLTLTRGTIGKAGGAAMLLAYAVYLALFAA